VREGIRWWVCHRCDARVLAVTHEHSRANTRGRKKPAPTPGSKVYAVQQSVPGKGRRRKCQCSRCGNQVGALLLDCNNAAVHPVMES